jgi:hypothetical protein
VAKSSRLKEVIKNGAENNKMASKRWIQRINETKSWFFERQTSQALVAHTHNPSYLGGRDQEDGGSKPAWANSSKDPILKKPITEKAGGVAWGVGPEFKPQYHTQKDKQDGQTLS